MLLATLLAAFLVCAQASVLPAVPVLDGKIVGGSPAQITEAPYQVAFLLDYWGIGSFSQACGGSIISRSVILTAAHCTDISTAARIRVRAGSTYHNSGGQVVAVSRIVQHSSFNSRSYDYDVSLLHLATQLTLGSGVAIVTLPAQGATVADGSACFVTGWGTLSDGGSSPTQLYKVTVPSINQQTCVNAYATRNPVTTRMLCAGLMGIGGQDACHGDSGGPLTIGGVLHGVTSWGNGCAQASYPGVYARVAEFRNWINNNM